MRNRATILLILLTLSITGCMSMNSGSDEPPRRVDFKNLHDVRDARNNLIGKAPPEVQQFVGNPDRQTSSADREWWTYEDRFRDPVTDRRLPVVTFYFHKGRLEDVTF